MAANSTATVQTVRTRWTLKREPRHQRPMATSHPTLDSRNARPALCFAVGAASAVEAGVVTFTNTIIRNNVANDRAGALWQDGGTATVEYSSIRANSANGGGALFIYGGSLNLRHTTFIDNSDASGGAFACHWFRSPQAPLPEPAWVHRRS